MAKIGMFDLSKTYSVYAQTDSSGFVTNIYANILVDAAAGDTLLGSGRGYDIVKYLETVQINDEQGSPKYKIENGKLLLINWVG